jgi:cytochrome c biogenesis protein CcdA
MPPILQTVLTYYGVVSIATMLFFWVFTFLGFLSPELRNNAKEHGMTLLSALIMGFVLGLTWPKSMFKLFQFIRKGAV